MTTSRSSKPHIICEDERIVLTDEYGRQFTMSAEPHAIATKIDQEGYKLLIVTYRSLIPGVMGKEPPKKDPF